MEVDATGVQPIPMERARTLMLHVITMVITNQKRSNPTEQLRYHVGLMFIWILLKLLMDGKIGPIDDHCDCECEHDDDDEIELKAGDTVYVENKLASVSLLDDTMSRLQAINPILVHLQKEDLATLPRNHIVRHMQEIKKLIDASMDRFSDGQEMFDHKALLLSWEEAEELINTTLADMNKPLAEVKA